MDTTPKSEATPPQMVAHARMQRIFRQHQAKFDRHRAKGPAFAAALDDLEKKLFSDGAASAEDSESLEGSTEK